jgi:carbamoyl-phosphate synthase small subunit
MDYAIKNIQTLLEKNMPMFGICLGHQLLSLANGATTEKMTVGHHGRDCMVVGLTTTCVISAYYHLSCEFEPLSW